MLFAIDRAGLVGPDGATHQGAFDFTYMRCLPNLTIMAPADERECRQMLATGLTIDGPSSVRYPRGRGVGIVPLADLDPIPVGKAQVRREGKETVLFAFGTMVEVAEVVGAEIGATVINMRFVKPLDEDCIKAMANAHERIVTLEENMIAGGAGSAIAELLAKSGIMRPLLQLGLPDSFIDHGEREEQLALVGLDVAGVRHRLKEWLSKTPLPLDEYATEKQL